MTKLLDFLKTTLPGGALVVLPRWLAVLLLEMLNSSSYKIDSPVVGGLRVPLRF